MDKRGNMDRTEYMRKYSEKRRMDPKYREAQKARYKSWAERNPSTPERRAKNARRMKDYRNDPLLRPRHEARWKVNRAIEAGKLERQPCEKCGAVKSEAHHDDYTKPLEVRWLCKKHHAEYHAKATQP